MSDQYDGMTPAQYHANMDKLWSAVSDKSICKDGNVFDRVVAELQQLRSLLRELEWVNNCNVWLECPKCKAAKEDGHTKDCRLDAALRGDK